MEANSTDATEQTDGSTRDRRPNVTLDYEGIQYENSYRLRKSRSSAKGNVTNKIREVTEFMSTTNGVDEVQSKAQEFYEAALNSKTPTTRTTPPLKFEV